MSHIQIIFRIAFNNRSINVNLRLAPTLNVAEASNERTIATFMTITDLRECIKKINGFDLFNIVM